MTNNADILAAGLDQLDLTLSPTVQATLLEFLAFLQKWNKAYNLTAVHDAELVTHHLLDSLSILPYLRGDRILDIGSGGGFPGIPLALALPAKHFTLLDSKAKKTAFLRQVVATFRMKNVEVVQARIESYQPAACFDNIVARAFGSLHMIIKNTDQALCPQGQWLMMKGVYPEQELQAIASPATVHRLNVPGVEAERHLVVIKK